MGLFSAFFAHFWALFAHFWALSPSESLFLHESGAARNIGCRISVSVGIIHTPHQATPIKDPQKVDRDFCVGRYFSVEPHNQPQVRLPQERAHKEVSKKTEKQQTHPKFW